MASLRIGDRALPFQLPGVDGRTYSLDHLRGRKVAAVIFWCNHCPYVQAWEDRVLELQRRYRPSGNVEFVLVNSNDPEGYPEDSFESMQRRAREKGYPCPYLFDGTQEVALAYGATRTPEVFLFDGDLVLRYHGRPDDNYEDPAAVRHPYLRDAIEAVLAGRAPAVAETQPVGCSIKLKARIRPDARS